MFHFFFIFFVFILNDLKQKMKVKQIKLFTSRRTACSQWQKHFAFRWSAIRM